MLTPEKRKELEEVLFEIIEQDRSEEIIFKSWIMEYLKDTPEDILHILWWYMAQYHLYKDYVEKVTKIHNDLKILMQKHKPKN